MLFAASSFFHFLLEKLRALLGVTRASQIARDESEIRSQMTASQFKRHFRLIDLVYGVGLLIASTSCATLAVSRYNQKWLCDLSQIERIHCAMDLQQSICDKLT